MKYLSQFASKHFPLLVVLLFLVIALRLFLMASLPLMDTSEARYAELARVTVAGNYWLMPHMTPAQPFFAKPPLSIWFAALSWMSFGHNELALRLPSLLMVTLTCIALLYGASSYKLSRRQWVFSCFVIITAPIGFISAGAVMTDATQLAVVTWAMVFLWRIIQTAPNDHITLNTKNATKNSLKFDQFGLWFMLGLAALAKGLATWVLIGLPMALFWLFTPKQIVMAQIKKIWFWPGVLVFTCVVLAWYIPAELYYPGFLKYFIVGEHFQRFMDPGWKGDMYGTAHREVIGTIWLYWVMSITLWMPLFIMGLIKDKPLFNTQLSAEKKWLWAWVLAPLIFFTFSRNIIWTYTLTSVPAFSILAALSWSTLSIKCKQIMQFVIVCWLILMVFAAAFWLPTMAEARSARKLVLEATTQYPEMALYSYGSHEFSVSYYTKGKIRTIENQKMLNQVLLEPNNLLIMSTDLAKQTELSGKGTILDINAYHALLITQMHLIK